MASHVLGMVETSSRPTLTPRVLSTPHLPGASPGICQPPQPLGRAPSLHLPLSGAVPAHQLSQTHQQDRPMVNRTEVQFQGPGSSLAVCPWGHLSCEVCRGMYLDRYRLSPPSLSPPTSLHPSAVGGGGARAFGDPFQGKLSWETD